MHASRLYAAAFRAAPFRSDTHGARVCAYCLRERERERDSDAGSAGSLSCELHASPVRAGFVAARMHWPQRAVRKFSSSSPPSPYGPALPPDDRPNRIAHRGLGRCGPSVASRDSNGSSEDALAIFSCHHHSRRRKPANPSLRTDCSR